MNYRFVQSSSLVTPITRQDTLFCGSYTIDPYQNCEFRCQYCDSATHETVYIKSNAVQLLKKEIQHLPKGMIILGSVHDPYQHAEQTYQITRTILQLLHEYTFPVHILTKSSLVLRDIDVLSKLTHCTVTLSITTLNNSYTDILEPSAPSPQQRLQCLKTLTEHGIQTGIAVMPIIPLLIEDELEQIVQSVACSQGQYLLHSYLELKGDQKNNFLKLIEQTWPHLLHQYRTLYTDTIQPSELYTKKIDKKIRTYCKKYGLATKIFLK